VIYDVNPELFQTLTHYECVVDPRFEQLLHSIKEEAFKAMGSLDGWCTTEKASVMIDLIAGTRAKKIVEIGVWGGKSLIPMAIAVKRLGGGVVYGIDPWDARESMKGMDDANRNWWENVNHEAVYKRLLRKINEFGLRQEVNLIRNTSEGSSPIFDIDLLHIDGNHSEKTSLFDITKWVPLVKSGGIVVVDDVTWVIDGKCSQEKSVLWLDEHCIKVAEYRGDNVFGIWRKP
jgi:predicted O-methyltransferase YrrM